MMSALESDRIKARLYNEFFREHKDLYKRDKQVFAHEQRRYVDREFMKYKYPETQRKIK